MRWGRNIKDPTWCEWHDYFAWLPVEINGQSVWLETIERRGQPDTWRTGLDWFYRLKGVDDRITVDSTNNL